MSSRAIGGGIFDGEEESQRVSRWSDGWPER